MKLANRTAMPSAQRCWNTPAFACIAGRSSTTAATCATVARLAPINAAAPPAGPPRA